MTQVLLLMVTTLGGTQSSTSQVIDCKDEDHANAMLAKFERMNNASERIRYLADKLPAPAPTAVPESRAGEGRTLAIIRESIAITGAHRKHDYIGPPKDFVPHDWVVRAVDQAYCEGQADGRR